MSDLNLKLDDGQTGEVPVDVFLSLLVSSDWLISRFERFRVADLQPEGIR
jgi:hypothetical protein